MSRFAYGLIRARRRGSKAGMPITRTDLFDCFDHHGISHVTTDHRPIFTVEEGRDIKAALPGGHSKNLFLKDKKDRLVLVSALGESEIRINQLHRHFDCQRLSFGKEELLYETLGVRPGSVTAFALLNDTRQQVRFIVDQALMEHDPVNFHPLENTATTAIKPQDLLKFARLTGHEPTVFDFTALL